MIDTFGKVKSAGSRFPKSKITSKHPRKVKKINILVIYLPNFSQGFPNSFDQKRNGQPHV